MPVNNGVLLRLTDIQKAILVIPKTYPEDINTLVFKISASDSTLTWLITPKNFITLQIMFKNMAVHTCLLNRTAKLQGQSDKFPAGSECDNMAESEYIGEECR
jgi:hypothetical protein